MVVVKKLSRFYSSPEFATIVKIQSAKKQTTIANYTRKLISNPSLFLELQKEAEDFKKTNIINSKIKKVKGKQIESIF